MSPVEYEDWGHPIWNVTGPVAGQPYEPFEWQREHIHKQSGRRNILAACGRRSGKTEAIKQEAIREVFREGDRPPLIYVMAPSYELAMKVWEPLWRMFVNLDGPLHFMHVDHDKQRKIIDLANGARLQAKTTDDPKSLQGDRVTAAFPDEAQDIMKEAWDNFLPALLDSRGALRAIGIAKGKGTVFRSFYERGLLGLEDWYSFSVPSTANPEITEDDLERERERFSDTAFRQQYLAEWAEDDGSVFRNVSSIFTGVEREPVNHPTIMSLDVGKQHDYTWAMVGDVTTQEVIAQDRFTGLDYTVQVPRIANLYRKYNCTFIHMDDNGVGQAPADFLRAEGCSIVPFKWSNERKAAMIGTLAREIERETFTVPSNWDILKRELELFEGTVLPGGLVRYSAPPGYWDDGVIALALLVEKMSKNRAMSEPVARKPYVSFKARPARAAIPPLPRPRQPVPF